MAGAPPRTLSGGHEDLVGLPRRCRDTSPDNAELGSAVIYA